MVYDSFDSGLVLRSKAGALERAKSTGACSQSPKWEHSYKIFTF
jgi:hypothetical protein